MAMFDAGDENAATAVASIAQDPELLGKLFRSIVEWETIDKLLEQKKNDKTPEAEKLRAALKIYVTKALAGVIPKDANDKEAFAKPDLIATGQRVFWENGMIAFAILGCASLPEAYATAYGAKVLGITAGLTEHVKRRLFETSMFLMNVMKQDNPDPTKAMISPDGINAALTVRLMHAVVRKLLKEPPPQKRPDMKPESLPLETALLQKNWQKEAWGEPVNQLSMGMAILSFSYIVLRSLRKLGIELNGHEEKAYLHCWNVVGKIMGVHDDLLLRQPETMEEAQELYERIWLRPGIIVRTEEARKLEAALLEYMEDFVPETFAPLRRIPRILTAELVSSKIAGAIGLRLDWMDALGLQMLRGLAHAQRFATGVAGVAGVDLDWAGTGFQSMLKAGGLRHIRESDIDQLPPMRLAGEFLFRQMAEGLNMQQDRGGRRGVFQIPKTLDKHWQIGADDDESV